jgi:SAM-dependent methyltransferase
MQSNQDAFGEALRACFRGKETHYIVEREDEYINPASLEMYFARYADWSVIEQRMPEFVCGKRVLDVGCGAGRHALYLQGLGCKVAAIDKSSGAIEVTRQRGAQYAPQWSLDDFIAREYTAPFDSIIMMGHNIGLLQDFKKGKEILKGLAARTTPHAVIIGTTRVPEKTNDPDHLAYQERNRERGRMPGQVRLRVRYKKLAGEWFDYLFLSEEELEQLAHGTGWRLKTTVSGDGGFGGESYLAVLCKE